MKNFKILDGEKVPSTMAGDITLTIGVHGDILIIEQPGDNTDPDLIMVYGKEDGRKLIKLLQEWIDSDYPNNQWEFLCLQ